MTAASTLTSDLLTHFRDEYATLYASCQRCGFGQCDGLWLDRLDRFRAAVRYLERRAERCEESEGEDY